MPELNVVRDSASIKDKMSQSSENHPQNFELRPRGSVSQGEVSISGEMHMLHPNRLATPMPQTTTTKPLAITVPENIRGEAARAEKAYQEGRYPSRSSAGAALPSSHRGRLP
ncbi:hypothetical protein LIER_24243 [Lithospermum erythrorhizon]|uniref:Uncharacterized protein n=1 Tax=Lithospermum erythrorhizon TaxID=34254 RepID=A0AAV3R3M1_LITER